MPTALQLATAIRSTRLLSPAQALSANPTEAMMIMLRMDISFRDRVSGPPTLL
jgi:hypothetical protein